MEQTIKKDQVLDHGNTIFRISFFARLDGEEINLINDRNAKSLTLINTQVSLIDNTYVDVKYTIRDLINGKQFDNEEFLNILRFEKVVKKCFKNFDKIITGLKDLPEQSFSFKPQ